MGAAMDMETLTAHVVAVKPSLANSKLGPQQSLVDDLGLDSLDVLQLLRKLQRTTGKELVIEDWADEETEKTGAKFTIASLLELLAT